MFLQDSDLIIVAIVVGFSFFLSAAFGLIEPCLREVRQICLFYSSEDSLVSGLLQQKKSRSIQKNSFKLI